MDDRSDAALVALRRILRATEMNSRLLARESDLTTSQLIVLQIVAREGKVTPSTVAQATSLTQATVTALVDKLERRGLVSRRRDTEDRRRIWLEPTATGRSTLAAAPDLLQERFRDRFQHLDDWEQAMLIAALERVSALLGAEAIDASPVLDVGDIDRPTQTNSDETAD
jgi:DNA-binding MarR family transcriptional regulator